VQPRPCLFACYRHRARVARRQCGSRQRAKRAWYWRASMFTRDTRFTATTYSTRNMRACGENARLCAAQRSSMPMLFYNTSMRAVRDVVQYAVTPAHARCAKCLFYYVH